MAALPLFIKYIIVFLISMVPLLELRGAIPFGVACGLPKVPVFIICIIGIGIGYVASYVGI